MTKEKRKSSSIIKIIQEKICDPAFWGSMLPIAVSAIITILVTITDVLSLFKETLGIDIVAFFQTPWVILVMILLISVFFSVICFLLTKLGRIQSLPDKESTIDEKSDSIMEMLNYANDNRQYSEVLKIGTAVSDVLWSTSRKALRIQVGNMVAAAANQLAETCKDQTDLDQAKRILAKTLIEDIGNTKMCLDAKMVNEAIENIKSGLNIAKKNHYDYETVRGHRNLANCYASKGLLGEANAELQHAVDAIKEINDAGKRTEAEFDVEYSKAKIFRGCEEYLKAIKCLQNCIDLYNAQLSKNHASKFIYIDRLVKIYREQGILYSKIPGMHTEARNAFQTGLSYAKERENHEEIVRCCTNLINLQLRHHFADTEKAVPNWIKDAEKNLSMVDTQVHIDEFNAAKKAWENQNDGAK